MTRALPRTEPLERLQQDEAPFEREIAEARRAAAAAVEAARKEAEAIVSRARREAEREAGELRRAAAEQADRTLAAERAALEAELAAIAERANSNGPRAIARALALTLAEDP
jgi:F0F1-type ATP synthase membrane subunit b/b'